MRILLKGGALPALLLASAAVAQPVADTPALDTEEPAFEAATPPPPAPTGDATLDRLNALEAKVQALEARNHSLEDALNESTTRIQTVEVRAARGVQANVAPIHADPGGAFTFKARGVLDVDYVHFAERAGGYDFNSGTGFRRARLGFEGTAFKDWSWRLEVDFAGNVVAVQDAYLQYNGLKPLSITLGQFKAPFGLESNNSDNFNSFIERGMFTNAFGNAGAERRIGASVAYLKDGFTLTAGLFGDNESVGRSAGAPVTGAPDESYGANASVTWEPVLLRYDDIDVGDTPVVARVGNSAHSYTAAANWYLTPNFKLQFDYIRFAGRNTPLDPIGTRTRGDAVTTRLHIDW